MTNPIDYNALQVMFEEIMLKISAEPTLEFVGSSFSDLYIVLAIEHDGVYDEALIDLFAQTVSMNLYDEYKFLINDKIFMSMLDFLEIIDNMATYQTNISKYYETK